MMVSSQAEWAWYMRAMTEKTLLLVAFSHADLVGGVASLFQCRGPNSTDCTNFGGFHLLAQVKFGRIRGPRRDRARSSVHHCATASPVPSPLSCATSQRPPVAVTSATAVTPDCISEGSRATPTPAPG